MPNSSGGRCSTVKSDVQSWPSRSARWATPAAATPGERAHPLEQAIDERALGVAFPVCRTRQGHRHRDRVVLDEAEVHAIELHEAPHEQQGADEQGQRQRQFGDDEHAAQPRAAGGPAWPAPRTTRATSFVRLWRAGTRPNAMPVAIVTNAVKASATRSTLISWMRGSVGGPYSDDAPNGSERDEEAQAAAERREEHALGQHLPQQPRRAGAERRADRELAIARRARADIRFATLAHATSSTSATAPRNRRSAARDGSTIQSCSRPTPTPMCVFVRDTAARGCGRWR